MTLGKLLKLSESRFLIYKIQITLGTVSQPEVIQEKFLTNNKRSINCSCCFVFFLVIGAVSVIVIMNFVKNINLNHHNVSADRSYPNPDYLLCIIILKNEWTKKHHNR